MELDPKFAKRWKKWRGQEINNARLLRLGRQVEGNFVCQDNGHVAEARRRKLNLSSESAEPCERLGQFATHFVLRCHSTKMLCQAEGDDVVSDVFTQHWALIHDHAG